MFFFESTRSRAHLFIIAGRAATSGRAETCNPRTARAERRAARVHGSRTTVSRACCPNRIGGTNSTSPHSFPLVFQRKWGLTELVPPTNRRIFDLSNRPSRCPPRSLTWRKGVEFTLLAPTIRSASQGAFRSGRSVAWYARLLGVQEVVSSNLTAPTIFPFGGHNPTHLFPARTSCPQRRRRSVTSQPTHASVTDTP